MNISSIKTNNIDSPKTPGGISKCYLTPCRRVGLSRKWKKSGISPFISPISSSQNKNEVKQDTLPQKRKICSSEAEEKDVCNNSSQDLSNEEEVCLNTCNTPKIVADKTPTRTSLPRKKSRMLTKAQECEEIVEKVPQSIAELNKNNNKCNEHDEMKMQEDIKQGDTVSNCMSEDESMPLHKNIPQVTEVTKLCRTNSKSSNKLKILKSDKINNEPCDNNTEIVNEILQSKTLKKKSPNNLTKECIVVIQKKIFKTDKSINNNISSIQMKENVLKNSSASQTLDYDSDNVPLSDFNKTDNSKNIRNITEEKTENNKRSNDSLKPNTQIVPNMVSVDLVDSDFIEEKKVIVKKVEKMTSTTGLKNKAKEMPKSKLQVEKPVVKSSQTSNSDDDDDFDYGKSRTTSTKTKYDLVTKPVRAKSTGSITQRDVDDIKARIEGKKRMFLAKAMTNETKELRELIKKWQVGCRTAVLELLDLMKKKLPEQNMEYSELLRTLKIPPDLVGYDSDSDTFTTPDDATIILSAFKLN